MSQKPWSIEGRGQERPSRVRNFQGRDENQERKEGRSARCEGWVVRRPQRPQNQPSQVVWPGCTGAPFFTVLLFLKEGLSLGSSSPSRCGWLTSKEPESPCRCFPRTEPRNIPHQAGVINILSSTGIELGSSHMQGKHIPTEPFPQPLARALIETGSSLWAIFTF